MINKKGGYPSQNDFALSVSMARFGIELIAKGRIPSSKRLRVPL